MALAAARTHNASISLATRRALIVGGTSGIGEGIALRLARMKADVTVAGRSKEAGDKVVAAMKEVNPTGAYDFRQVDVSMMKNVKAFTKQYSEEFKQLNYLVVTAGIMTMQGRTETKEGIDVQLAIHYYGRWLLIKELVPTLESTADAGGEARVMTLLAAARGAPAPADDLDLKKNYGIKAAADVAPFHNDLMVEEFSIRHPKIPFIHIYPGAVNTPLPFRQASWYVRWAAKAWAPFATSVADAGEFMSYGLLNKEYAKGFFLLDSNGKPQKPLKAQTEDMRKKVWEHTEQLVSSALEK